MLPAGPFHRRLGFYDLELPGCPAPTVAVAACVFSTVTDAERAARSAGRGLAPGYPWVAHTRRAGLSGNGIAVVLAQWATREQGEAWRDEHAPNGLLLEVLDEDHALAALESNQGGPEREYVPHVVYVETATAAYSSQDVRAILTAGEQVSLDGDAYFAAVRQRSGERQRRAPPPCRIPAASVFISEGDSRVIHSREGFWNPSWQPVRCGGQFAWVPIETTQTTAVTWRHRDGRAWTTQVTMVECDVPVHTTWRRTPKGRVEPRANRSGC